MTLNERYQVHERVGEGGMALVYRATDLRLNRQVAVKMLRPQYASDPDFVDRFEQEARAAAALSHPNIAAVYDTGEDADVRYIVMELLRPFTLKDLIARSPDGRLDTAETVRIGTQIAAALAHAHHRGLVHRDIKPQNILFTDDGLVKVTDFGIARALAATGGTATGTILGSPHYISPEQASGEPAGPRSDLYSLGVVLYEMLCGEPPYSGETPIAIAVQHLRGTPQPLETRVPGVAPGLVAVVNRAMARSPEDRFASADEMRQAIDAAPTARPAVDLGATQVLPRVPGYPATQAMRRVEADAQLEPEPYRREPPPPRMRPGMVVFWLFVLFAAVFAGALVALRQPAKEENTGPKPVVDISGPQKIAVPDLRGQNADAARDWIEKTFKAQGRVAPQVVEADRKDNAAPANQILEQSPEPGGAMDEGGVIKVVVSTGRVPVNVPSVVGMPTDRAKQALLDAGLMLGNLEHAHSDTYIADVVMKQTPANGTAPQGTAVNLVVSLGPKPVEPKKDEPKKDEPRKDEPPTPSDKPDPLVAISHPEDIDNGLKQANVVVQVPPGSAPRKIELRWLQGGEGSAGSETVKGGRSFSKKVRGTPGSVLGLYIDGEQKETVQY